MIISISNVSNIHSISINQGTFHTDYTLKKYIFQTLKEILI